MILPIEMMVPLPHTQDLQNPLGTVVVRPFLTYVLAGVEKSFLGNIPWRLCRRGALTWLSVVICDVSGFFCYILHVFLCRIVVEEKGI